MLTKTLKKGVKTLEPDIALAHRLMAPYLPVGTHLEIEETDSKLCSKYIMRLIYTSKKSGRKMSVLAKGDNLPTLDDSTLRFYVMQLVLTPSEVGREFSRLYFIEKRARQEMWLAMGKSSRKKDNSGDTLSVIDQGLNADKLDFRGLGFRDYE